MHCQTVKDLDEHRYIGKRKKEKKKEKRKITLPTPVLICLNQSGGFGWVSLIDFSKTIAMFIETQARMMALSIFKWVFTLQTSHRAKCYHPAGPEQHETLKRIILYSISDNLLNPISATFEEGSCGQDTFQKLERQNSLGTKIKLFLDSLWESIWGSFCFSYKKWKHAYSP